MSRFAVCALFLRELLSIPSHCKMFVDAECGRCSSICLHSAGNRMSICYSAISKCKVKNTISDAIFIS